MLFHRKRKWFKKRAEEHLDVDEVMFDSFQLRSSALTWDHRIEPGFSYTPMRVVWALVLITTLIFLGRILYIELAQQQSLAAMAERNATKEVWEQFPRGIIYSNTHEELVVNESSFNLVAIPAKIPREYGEQERIISFLEHELEKDRAAITEMFEGMNRFSYRPVLLLVDVPREHVLSLNSTLDELPGIELQETLRRSYPEGSIFSHILGYTGTVSPADLERNPGYLRTDIVGKTGIEASYENVLRGIHGKTEIETNARGEEIRILGSTDPEPGDNLVLFIDANLQRNLTEVMQRVMREQGVTRAAAVAVNPKNGGVLALQSFPLYDNNRFSSRITPETYQELFGHPDNPLFNRAIAGRYPAGSTMKPFIAIAALEEGIIDEHFTVNVTGSITVAGQTFRDWRPHGPVNVRQAIAVSSNVFFYTVGGGHGGTVGLGPYRIHEHLSRVMLNSLFSIDIPGERAGFIPHPTWKRETRGEGWYVGDTYNTSIGQGDVAVTPLGLAMATAAIANGGTIVQPRIVQAVANQSMTEFAETQTEVLAHNIASPDTIRIVRESMRLAVTDGSVRRLSLLPIPTAGKTGTAQAGVGRNTHALFIAFAPYENPQIAIAVVVEHAGGGEAVAVPIVFEVFQRYFAQ